jgi:murein DD-endopeptidase MepM/ murein hydrolase activator NlpD
VYTIASVSLFSLLVVASSVVYSAIVSRKLVNYADTLHKNQQQQQEISSFSDKTNKVSRAVNELVQRDNELRKLLGLKTKESKIKLSTDIPSTEVKTKKVSLQLEEIDALLAERRSSLEELKSWVGEVMSHFASTPSIWPIHGRIASFMGYRSYPWRGYHAGIDIDAPYGSAARATADGIVTYTGWRRGYGKIVEISHGRGVTTLYAHNSGFAVRVGQKVKKGQIICYIGMTGWTTGPHLHYEVRRWGIAYNPVAYLDLNVLSASRLWR